MLEPAMHKALVEAGCDEAGRGCIAGPVYAAAVILPGGFNIPGLDDSKKLSAKKREHLRLLIEQQALGFSIGVASEREIEEINILHASILAMHRALEQLDPPPAHILVDGNRFKPFRDIPATCVVGGDARFASIAAASVLAKTYRDAYMRELHEAFPDYGWAKNAGYPTKAHREAIARIGASKYHRRTFRLLDEQMRIDFS
ncbi:MAG: ribonuclease HII [Bacteroidetes bacterium]|nr:MAG: ribonuclease HII [Bacteroidota bacterium]